MVMYPTLKSECRSWERFLHVNGKSDLKRERDGEDPIFFVTLKDLSRVFLIEKKIYVDFVVKFRLKCVFFDL